MTDLTLALECLGLREVAKRPKHSIQRGVLAAVGKKLGNSRSHVSNVFSGHDKSERIAGAICEASGLRAADLWPGQYPRLEKLQAMQGAQATKPAH